MPNQNPAPVTRNEVRRIVFDMMRHFSDEEAGTTLEWAITDALVAEFVVLHKTEEPQWEYAWMADEERRSQLSPRGPRLLIDGTPHTPEEIAAFPRGRRVRRRKAGPWEPAADTDEPLLDPEPWQNPETGARYSTVVRFYPQSPRLFKPRTHLGYSGDPKDYGVEQEGGKR